MDKMNNFRELKTSPNGSLFVSTGFQFFYLLLFFLLVAFPWLTFHASVAIINKTNTEKKNPLICAMHISGHKVHNSQYYNNNKTTRKNNDMKCLNYEVARCSLQA